MQWTKHSHCQRKNLVDPLGGSWYLEYLTDKIENEAENYFKKIEGFGGVIPAIEDGYFQREISKSASDYQYKVDNLKRVVVGINMFEKKNEEIPVKNVNPLPKKKIN